VALDFVPVVDQCEPYRVPRRLVHAYRHGLIDRAATKASTTAGAVLAEGASS